MPPRSSPTPGETPARLLWLALAWVAASLLPALLATLLAGIVVGIHNGFVSVRHGTAWTVGSNTYGLVALAAAQLGLVWAAGRRARVVGGGSRAAGFGDGPLRRPWLLGGLAGLHVVVVTVWVVLLTRLLAGSAPAAPSVLRAATAPDVVAMLSADVLLVVLAPLWEELFFRGWLWTGLRRHWPVRRVMAVTSVFWLLVHLPDGLTRPLFLIPAAVMFAVARQLCGLRASLMLHALNNLLAAGILALVAQAARH